MSIRAASLSLVFVALTASLSAQQPRVLAPHKPIEPIVTPQPNWHLRAPTQRSMVGGFWMIDANFRSAIYLKNGVENAPITVTPILYLSNGKSYTLPDVKLEPSGTAIVDINDELDKQGIASWATLSGYVEVKYTWAWDPICVTVQNIDTAHSLVFAYFLRPAPSGDHVQSSAAEAQQIQTLEGMWWKQESNVAGFVALSNALAQPITANVVVGDNQGKPIRQHTVTVSPHGTKLLKLDEMQSAPSSEGGITVTYQGLKDALQVNGGLEDPGSGYSATLRFHSPPSPSAKPPAGGYAELGLMAGAADPMMSFPARTVFTPYSIVRNITARPVAVTPVLWWMEAGAPRSARLSQMTLPSHSTTSLPVNSLLVQAGLKNFNGSLNLILEADTKPGELLIDSGSVDQSNTYVFEVVPQAIGESMAKSLSYWSTGKGDDTMITIWNPADEAQDFVLTLLFSGGSYKYPIPLGPRATRTFNISEIIHSQIPDADGNLVPTTVHEGSAKISGSRAEHERILVGIAVGVYNVQKATCPPQCTKCDTADDAEFNFDPFAVGTGGTTIEQVVVRMTTGTIVDASASATWKSSNTAVASVSAGTVKGVGAGTITLSATTTQDWPIGGFDCGDGCPVAAVSPPAAPGTVQTPTSLKVLSYPALSLTSVGCVATDYGMAIAITYQVLDQNGSPMQSSSMEPQEKILNQAFNGSDPISPYPNWVDIYNPNWPGSAQYTTSTGQFLDAPFAVCAGVAFTETLTQPISMLMNGTNYTVRTNSWKTVTTVPGGHGTMSNGSDINASN
jgi:hypothetical protein